MTCPKCNSDEIRDSFPFARETMDFVEHECLECGHVWDEGPDAADDLEAGLLGTVRKPTDTLRLLQAAPDLFAALTDLVEQLQAKGLADQFSLDAVAAALDKATGGSK